MDGPENKMSPQAPLSPPGSPLRAHESIWKRSKKILGMSRFAFLQQIDAQGPAVQDSASVLPSIMVLPEDTVALSPVQALSFLTLRTKLISWLDKTSPGGSDGANGKPPVSKRREQVRRAQKTHRQRTENYIKALEQEVLRLQKEEAARAWERQNRQHSDAYVKALEKQVIELQKEKALVLRDNESQFPAATLTLYDQNGEWALKAELPQYPAYVTPSEISSPSYGSDSSYCQPYSSNWHNLMLINPLANHQTAIDFVLSQVNPSCFLAKSGANDSNSVESACMQHLHQHFANPGAVNGHALTASACLIEQGPQDTSLPASWTTSHAEIERLFQLASNLGLDGEITPVEAWNRIWQHPFASRLSPGGLQVIESGMKKMVSCYGFGGAIKEKDFSIILDNAIAQG